MTTPGPESTRTPQRCSDAEREQASAHVRQAAAEGRLTMAELEDRLSTIYAARYRHELSAVAADLPQPEANVGWSAIATLAWHQLTTDLAGLTGRDRTALSRRQQVALVFALLAAVLLLVGLASLVIHGLLDDGRPDRGYDRY